VVDVTCALIINNQFQVFATQRSSTMNLALKWELPGGKIEQNETPEECLIREIKEEINIEIKIIGSLPYNVHIYPSITIKLIPFICTHLKGDIILKEHVNFKWLNPKELLDLDWADADILILKHYLNYIDGI
jgi:8-oxo-dGTP diphosphatase